MTTMQLAVFLIGCVFLGVLYWDLKQRFFKKSSVTQLKSKKAKAGPLNDESKILDGALLEGLEEGILDIRIKEPTLSSETAASEDSEKEQKGRQKSRSTETKRGSPTKNQSSVHRADQAWTSLYVMARDPEHFTGQQLADVFQAIPQLMPLNFGQESTYHYQDKETSESLFSIASATEPGSLLIQTTDKIGSFKTAGLVLFMKITNPHKALHGFEQMLRIARQLAARLEGDLKDQSRNHLTIQSIEKVRETIREVSRKLLLDERLNLA